tara:strand:- start:692 stop:2623 length:1932 start_codon:yes stop_codon:yes gene_type:complete
MFKKVLIANRGEIACRIIETCKRLNIKTVSVYSSVDRNARHVIMADESYSIPEADPSKSYMSGQDLINICKKSGAEAIHPGYGFLSENSKFAKLVGNSGLIFVGPSPEAIALMGHKDKAKALMEKAGVPIVPGYHGKDQKNLKRIAEKIGYPVLIKAIAGGGGRGMRIVRNPETFLSLLNEAKSEALKSFGNDKVIIEKYIEKSRHIEVQVFGDGKNIISLYERDCSLQRRHQKIIEEAPAPGISEQKRSAICAAAVRAAQAVSYKGAGTVEFIVNSSDEKFYFLEMNTRLQVEHPVTEEILGLDLVEWQLRVAFGEELPFKKIDFKACGHAIEARIYAEDVSGGFLPASGLIEKLIFPENIRIDTGVSEGDKISTYYDPMIAKIIVHEKSRAEAIVSLKRALSKTYIMGLKNNLEFLECLISTKDFKNEYVYADTIDKQIDNLIVSRTPSSQVLALASLGILGFYNKENINDLTGFSLWENSSITVSFFNNMERVLASVKFLGGSRFLVKIDNHEHKIIFASGAWQVDNEKVAFEFIKSNNNFCITLDRKYDFHTNDNLEIIEPSINTGNTFVSPMPGQISAVNVKEGDHVKVGDRLVVLESMKMEHAITATANGLVKSIVISPEQQVNEGDILLSLDLEAT